MSENPFQNRIPALEIIFPTSTHLDIGVENRRVSIHPQEMLRRVLHPQTRIGQLEIVQLPESIGLVAHWFADNQRVSSFAKIKSVESCRRESAASGDDITSVDLSRSFSLSNIAYQIIQ
jgi:hypothetical protein